MTYEIARLLLLTWAFEPIASTIISFLLLHTVTACLYSISESTSHGVRSPSFWVAHLCATLLFFETFAPMIQVFFYKKERQHCG